MSKLFTNILAVLLLASSAHAQEQTTGGDGGRRKATTINYARSLARAEIGDRRGLLETAVLIYMESPHDDGNTLKGNWEVGPTEERRMRQWTLEQAMWEIVSKFGVNYQSSSGEGKSGLELCVWQTRMLKLNDNQEVDDQLNIRLMPRAVTRAITYHTADDPCLDGELPTACSRRFTMQAERDNHFVTLSKADRVACIRRGTNWHVQP